MLNRHILLRLTGAMIAAFLGLRFAIAPADAAQLDSWALEPSMLFFQAAAGDQRTQSYAGGATWDWSWNKQYSFMTASGYFEAAGGRWTTRDRRVTSSTWATQVDVTPVIRLQPAARFSCWFAELGVGANYIIPLYRTDHKRFSTEFNFGDHFAIGRQFGERRQHELALRVEHFSNAGIEHPNPGENFLQIRYSYRL
jgi:lipid A 3-O-deacylase